MKRFAFSCAAAILAAALSIPAWAPAATARPAAGDPRRDRVRYEKRYRDPVLKAMEHEADSINAAADSVSKAVQKACRDKKKKEEEEKPVVRFDWTGIAMPSSVEAFKAPFHFPPHRQFRTGTCWCFSTTSFFESEMKRLNGQEIKLSEMYTVYWEYVEKALGYIAKRGCQPFSQGSESDAVILVWKKYGIVPDAAYAGLAPGKTRYDDEDMTAEMAAYLEFSKDHDYWDENVIISQIRAILDKYMGTPPEEFDYDGARYTPKRFLDEVVKLKLDDYVQVMSTLLVPFYTKDEYVVPDNWRPTKDYYNVPLDEFCACVTRATSRGYTVAIGGDVSEPGLDGFKGAAIIPTFDIPDDYIDQSAREFRFDNRTTQDDHGVHLLASLKVGGHDWFLIKDSMSSAYWGPHKGYYFYRDDYVRLKMLSIMVHKDMAAPILEKTAAQEAKGKGEQK
jgi:bleomycin hydrolase